MVIKKIIADKRPMFCCECPLLNSGIRTLKKVNVANGRLL